MLRYIDDNPASYPGIFENAVTKITEKDETVLISALKKLNTREDLESAVDTEEVMRYFVVHSFVVNGDSYTGNTGDNYYLYERGGKLKMIPWDYNFSFRDDVMTDWTEEEHASVTVNYPIDTPVTGGGVSERPMLAWILEDGAYTEKYHELYREFMKDVYENNWLQEEIARVSAMTASCLETDPTLFISYEEIQNAVEGFRLLCDLRCKSVAGQLDGTIPSTGEGQAQNPDTLVDASMVKMSEISRPPYNQLTEELFR